MKKGPPTSVRSVRLPDETWAALDVEAKRRATSVNAMMAGAATALIHPGYVFQLEQGQKAIRDHEMRREATPPSAKPFVNRLKGVWKAP